MITIGKNTHNQQFTDFEVIIIDDGSTDGTKNLILQFMQQDDRINCLTHPYNIGLPAISEYEAFMKATGEYIMFAFDDFIYEAHAFAALYQAISETEGYFCYGLANLHYFNNGIMQFITLGEQRFSSILMSNHIAPIQQ